jgi:hypothetical protein
MRRPPITNQSNVFASFKSQTFYTYAVLIWWQVMVDDIIEKAKDPSSFRRNDWLVLFLLTFAAAIIYLPFPYYFPYQINTDEFAIRDCILSLPKSMNWFYLLGPSGYNGFPTLVHVVFGQLADLLGGVTFTNLRTVHALFGVACMPLAFFFFRSLGLTAAMSAAASLIAIFNHALIAISRMVSRNNTSLFIELAALAILFKAFEKRSPFTMYLGGLLAGLSFYTYTPARTTFPTFLLAVFLITLFDRRINRVDALKTVAPSLVSFALTVAPMIWVTMHSPPEINQYQNAQFLFTEAGLKNEQHQVSAASVEQGYLINVAQGLSAFNLPIPDNGYIYINKDAGFLDFVTGGMIWIGVFFIFSEKRRRIVLWHADILCTSGFFGLMFVYAFLITFAPDYTRLFTTLPFVAYLAVHGVALMARVIGRLIEPNVIARVVLEKELFWATIASIVISNFLILALYTYEGVHDGQVHGGTYRYKELRAQNRNWNFFLVVEPGHPYYHRGIAVDWGNWVDGSRIDSHTKVLNPTELESALLNHDDRIKRPATIFMEQGLWQREKPIFDKYAPNSKVTAITTKEGRVAIDLK